MHYLFKLWFLPFTVPCSFLLKARHNMLSKRDLVNSLLLMGCSYLEEGKHYVIQCLTLNSFLRLRLWPVNFTSTLSLFPFFPTPTPSLRRTGLLKRIGVFFFFFFWFHVWLGFGKTLIYEVLVNIFFLREVFLEELHALVLFKGLLFLPYCWNPKETFLQSSREPGRDTRDKTHKSVEAPPWLAPPVEFNF